MTELLIYAQARSFECAKKATRGFGDRRSDFFSRSLLQVMNETAVWNEMNSFWA
jgi:hypothetical protein